MGLSEDERQKSTGEKPSARWVSGPCCLRNNQAQSRCVGPASYLEPQLSHVPHQPVPSSLLLRLGGRGSGQGRGRLPPPAIGRQGFPGADAGGAWAVTSLPPVLDEGTGDGGKRVPWYAPSI